MWLIQRCTPKVKVYNGEKVSDYMSLDYMGSAEFEFGAIPKSIRKLAQKNLIQSSFKYRNKKGHDFTIHLLTDEKDKDEVIRLLTNYLDGAKGARRLKEWIRLGDIVDENGMQSSEPETFWWCVDEQSGISLFNAKNSAEKNRLALSDPQINFCFSLDPEQCRCFKLALQKSFDFMNQG